MLRGFIPKPFCQKRRGFLFLRAENLLNKKNGKKNTFSLAFIKKSDYFRSPITILLQPEL